MEFFVIAAEKIRPEQLRAKVEVTYRWVLARKSRTGFVHRRTRLETDCQAPWIDLLGEDCLRGTRLYKDRPCSIRQTVGFSIERRVRD